jgi:hypothetical protein
MLPNHCFDNFEISPGLRIYQKAFLNLGYEMVSFFMLRRKNIPQRIVIYPRDIANITGCAGRTAQRLLQNIRQVFEKQKFQFVTVQEFCLFAGIDEETVRKSMVD